MRSDSEDSDSDNDGDDDVDGPDINNERGLNNNARNNAQQEDEMSMISEGEFAYDSDISADELSDDDEYDSESEDDFSDGEVIIPIPARPFNLGAAAMGG